MDFQSLGNTSVIGLQWGDEGKGKIVDLLTEHFDIVVRYAGGANAGHTVHVGSETFSLHLIPSGILRREVLNVIGPGVALDLEILCGEIKALRDRNIHVGRNLLISERAHLVMPYHKEQDRLEEARLGTDRMIGTTCKGIGPCYADKMLRTAAFRLADLHRPEAFRQRLAEVVADRNHRFAALYGDCQALDAQRMADEFLQYADEIQPHVADTTLTLHNALTAGKRLLLEGAQGSLLDINHGTFPYVTSSICTSGGAAAAAGIAPSAITDYIGVIKAYSTRVGSGPFPTELSNAIGEGIRQRGHEFGTTTGRPRRCGWFDAVAVRYAIDLSGITQLVIMHLDTLAGMDEVCICTGYRHRGEALTGFPADPEVLEESEPIYETLPGWSGNLSQLASYGDMPAAAQSYVDRLETLLGVPITLVSVGSERLATLHRSQAAETASAPA